MIGRPKVVCIDEATIGVDQTSCKKMWKAIRDEGRESAIVLTTTSVVEAESVSSKIGILVGGKFKCFGSSEQIKHEYGQGYEVEFNFDQEALIADLK